MPARYVTCTLPTNTRSSALRTSSSGTALLTARAATTTSSAPAVPAARYRDHTICGLNIVLTAVHCRGQSWTSVFLHWTRPGTPSVSCARTAECSWGTTASMSTGMPRTARKFKVTSLVRKELSCLILPQFGPGQGVKRETEFGPL